MEGRHVHVNSCSGRQRPAHPVDLLSANSVLNSKHIKFFFFLSFLLDNISWIKISGPRIAIGNTRYAEVEGFLPAAFSSRLFCCIRDSRSHLLDAHVVVMMIVSLLTVLGVAL